VRTGKPRSTTSEANELEPNPNILKDRALAILAQGKLKEGS
jgi:hypothetical protein